MMKQMKNKKLKIKISNTDIEQFPYEMLEIDEYWKSLYEDDCKKRKMVIHKRVIYEGAK